MLGCFLQVARLTSTSASAQAIAPGTVAFVAKGVFADFDARVEDERFADNVRIVLHIRAENSQKLTDKLVDVCNGAVSVEEIEKLNFDFA